MKEKNQPGQLAGNSERAREIFFHFYILIYLKSKTIVSRNGESEMACLLGIEFADDVTFVIEVSI